MGLDHEQKQVLTIALHEAHRFGATPREKKALVEALIVESNIKNLNYGDRDSLGPLQQRPSQGWKHPRNVRLAVRDFLSHARDIRNTRGSAGKLAQGVQGSAFPRRYDEVAGKAQGLLGQYSGQDTGVVPGVGNVGRTSGMRSVTTDDPDAIKRVALANYLTRTKPQSLLLRSGAVSVDEPTTRTSEVPIPASSPGTPPASGAGARPSGGKSPLFELIYHGGGEADYAVKNGQKVSGTGVYGAVWDGHKDHVHVAAGPKTVVMLGKIAQSMGLHVGENPHFGGVNPVHAPNSYHYKGEAIDVSGDKELMRRFAKKVEEVYSLA